MTFDPASFRDPNGRVFRYDGLVYRYVAESYAPHYKHLMESGLYKQLVANNLLIPHTEHDPNEVGEPRAWKVLKPKQLSFISYAYEWCFNQLKDAALLTLRVQQVAMEHGMTLKDASAFNVQFYNGRATHIDTLSFEIYEPGKPWAAYKQFCEHFLAPLALSHYSGEHFARFLQVYPDGIPATFARSVLPRRSKLNTGILLHLHVHAKAQSRLELRDNDAAVTAKPLPEKSLRQLVDHLKQTVEKLRWTAESRWATYYEPLENKPYMAHKLKAVKAILEQAKPATVWDIGANDGTFSRLAAATGSHVISIDNDPAAVQQNYDAARAKNLQNILPLVADMSNPTPALGWANAERPSVIERGPCDMVLALALVHHLAIGHNLPLPDIARLMARLGKQLLIELVPKTDPMVQKMLRFREDHFSGYTPEAFELAFGEHFTIKQQEQLHDSERVLYWMTAKTD